MLEWSKHFSIFLYLDSNHYADRYGRFECLLAAGARSVVQLSQNDGLSEVFSYYQQAHDWLFGHIGYDYKNELERGLTSSNSANIGFEPMYFFCPEYVVYIKRGEAAVVVETIASPLEIFRQICNQNVTVNRGLSEPLPKIKFSCRIDRQNYIAAIEKIRNHIREGDFYELNYCCEGFCEEVQLNPHSLFYALNQISPAPFAAFYKNSDKFMACASPERYLNKTGSQLVSQPIKGTAKRILNDEVADEKLKEDLHNSVKERAENMMIVDLVRNDLARCCKTGSVKVAELFGIYSFPQVHQMISTVSGVLRDDIPFTSAFKYTFPMGSMTGAPKYKVMQVIDEYEKSRRELFSGTVGYISPNGDFDFNVVIRSLFYNVASRYLSYQTGGAITWDSVAEQEWEELKLKAWALEKIFAE